MSRLTIAVCALVVIVSPASAVVAGEIAEAFELLSRRNPSLRTGIVSVVRLKTGTGVLHEPALETRRRVLFDRDKGLVRLDQTQSRLGPDEQGEQSSVRHVFIRTSDIAIILRPHRRTIDIIPPEHAPPLFDPLSVGLVQDVAMDNMGGVSKQLEILREFESKGRLVVSTLDASENERVVSFQLSFPEWSYVSEMMYWFSTDRGNVPVRFLTRKLKQADDGSLQPNGPNDVDFSVHWIEFKGAFVPREQTITERVLNPAGEVLGSMDTGLTFEWEMVNEDFEDMSVFSVESLDVPKGSHKIVDGRSGEPIVIQDPRIPSAAMLAQLNEEVRRRRTGEKTAEAPALMHKDRSDFQWWLVVSNLAALLAVVVIFFVRRTRLRRNSK